MIQTRGRKSKTKRKKYKKNSIGDVEKDESFVKKEEEIEEKTESGEKKRITMREQIAQRVKRERGKERYKWN